MAVHIRGIGPAAAHIHLGLAVEALAEDLHGVTQPALIEFVHDAGLDIHQQLRAAQGFLFAHAVPHLRSGRSLLGRIGEHAGPLDLFGAQEGAQLFKGSLVLIGQTRDDAGAQHQTGNTRPELGEQFREVRLVAPAVHFSQHLVAAMLDGNVEIGQDLFLPGHRVDQFLGDLVRIEVVQADPVDAADGAEFTQQFRQLVAAVQVDTVAGDVLGDDDQFLHAAAGQLLRLRQDIFHGAAAVFAPQGGDDAVGAVVVAALGDAQIRRVFRREQDAVALVHRRVDAAEKAGRAARRDLLQGIHDVHIAAAAQNAVHLGQFREDLLAVALGKAAGHQNLFDPALRLQLRGAEDMIDGLGLGAVDKAAGVDDHHVRRRVLPAQGVAAVAHQGHHLLTVDQVFCAAQ